MSRRLRTQLFLRFSKIPMWRLLNSKTFNRFLSVQAANFLEFCDESLPLKVDQEIVFSRLDAPPIHWHRVGDFPALLVLAVKFPVLRDEKIVRRFWLQLCPSRVVDRML